MISVCLISLVRRDSDQAKGYTRRLAVYRLFVSHSSVGRSPGGLAVNVGDAFHD